MEAIFIGGCSRSGTTLLGSMLGAGPDNVTTPESPFKIHPLASSYERNRGELSPADLRHLANDWFLATWGIPVRQEHLAAASAVASGPPSELPDGNVPGWERSADRGKSLRCANGSSRRTTSVSRVMVHLVRSYAARIGKVDTQRWIDHTPANIRYATTLLQHFPEARFLHLVRDGRAVAASVMRLDWGPNTAKEAARWWTSYVAYGLAAEQALPADRILRVRFEDLVLRSRETMQQICGFCRMPFHDSMLAAGGFRVPPYTAAQHRLVGGPPRQERVSGWRVELTPREVEIFEYYTGEALSYLGYPLQYGLAVKPPSVIEKWRMEIHELLGRSLNKCYFAWRKNRYAA